MIYKFNKQKSFLAWHFIPENCRLRHERRPRLVKVGKKIKHRGKNILLCSNGLHFSPRTEQADFYAKIFSDPHQIRLCLVKITGKGMVKYDYFTEINKGVATERTALWISEPGFYQKIHSLVHSLVSHEINTNNIKLTEKYDIINDLCLAASQGVEIV